MTKKIDEQINKIKSEATKQKNKSLIIIAGLGVCVFLLISFLLVNAMFFADQTQKYLDTKGDLKEQFTEMASNNEFQDDARSRMEFVTTVTAEMRTSVEGVNCNKVEEERKYECERVSSNVIDLDDQAKDVLRLYEENGDELTPELNSSIENFGSTLEVVRRLLGVELK